MDDLIKALLIFQKYIGNRYNPTACFNDMLIVDCQGRIMDEEDIKSLDQYGFHWDDETGCWASFRFGSF